jgi:hypothetical protein
MSRKGNTLLYTRANSDPVLRAVIADINMKAVKPDKGFLTREQWQHKWKLGAAHTASIYIERALKIGVLVKKRFRIVTKKRLRLVDHFGPPPRRKV